MNHNYTDTRYTQAVGGMGNYGSYWSGKPPEQLTYPNQPGSAYLTSYGAYGQEERQLPPFPAASAEECFARAPETGADYDSSTRVCTPLPFFPADPNVVPAPTMTALRIAYSALTIAGVAVGTYHGYKRNDSIGWAIVWGFMGSLVPVVVIPLAYAQGIGKRKRR